MIYIIYIHVCTFIEYLVGTYLFIQVFTQVNLISGLNSMLAFPFLTNKSCTRYLPRPAARTTPVTRISGRTAVNLLGTVGTWL